MRVIVTLGILLLAQAATPPDVQNRPAGHLQIPDTFWLPCEIRTVVARIGRTADIPVGFEAGSECTANSMAEATGYYMADGEVGETAAMVDLTASTVSAAFDAIVARAPEYSWKNMGGVIVVRPKSAWADTSDSLSRLLPTEMDSLRLDGGINSVLGKRGMEIATSGTLLDRLNAAARLDGAGQWVAINLTSVVADEGKLTVVVFRAGRMQRGSSMSMAIKR